MALSSFRWLGSPTLRTWLAASLCSGGLLLACGQLQGQDDPDDDIGDDDAAPDARRPDGGPGRTDGGRRPADAGPDADDEDPYTEPECPNPPDPIYDFTCDPVAQDCQGPDEACMGYVDYPSSNCDAERYGSYCVPAGTGTQGDPCGYEGECAAGYWCLITGAGTRCARTCDLSAIDPCEDGRICVSTDVSGVGACL